MITNIKREGSRIERLKKSIKKKDYGLVWMNVPESFEDDVENKLPILKEVPDLAIKNEDGKPTHILIEGDNYHALTCLNYTHKEKVDVIYIDPPYNTGSDGFRYKDKRIISNFPDGTEVPKNHPFRHSYWLSFMRKRLELAKELLKKDGVIFISIDDNELSQLKLLCDEIFDANNYEATITYVRKTSGKQDSTNFAKSTEFILIYSRGGQWKSNQLKAEDKVTKRYNKIDENGKRYRESDLRKTGSEDSRSDRPDMWYPFYYNLDTKEIKVSKKINPKYHNSPEWIEILPIKSDGSEGRWRWGFNTAKDNIQNLTAKIMQKYKKQEKWTIYEIDFIDKNEESRTVKEHTFWDRTEFNSDNAIVDFTKMGFSNKDFNFPKSVELMKHILKLSTKKDSYILDFFAGSGTTGQATLELNEEDNGSRKFILCTNNENNLCTEVTYPRIKKVINGFNFKGKNKTTIFEKKLTLNDLKSREDIIEEFYEIVEKNKEVYDKIQKEFKNNTLKIIGIMNINDKKKGLGNSLKYYKTSFIGKNNILEANDEDKVELAHNAGELLAIAENTLESIKQTKYYQLFEDNLKERFTAIYFREELDQFEKFVKMVEKLNKKTTVYVFSWGDDEFTEEFKHIKDVKVKTIPIPILEIYKNIYNLGGYNV